MIVALLTSLVAVAAFAAALAFSGIAAVARRIMQAASDGMSVMFDPALDDLAKEKAARKTAAELFGGTLSLGVRIALCLTAALAPILAFDLLGVADRDAVFALMLRVDYIVVVSVLALIAVILLRRRPATNNADGHNTASERMIHAIAFASPAVLKVAATMERRGSAPVEGADLAPPIFVTSLARAGTTALLNALSAQPELATHTYRDMPFLTAPVLWDRLAGGAKRGVERHQRAHGDGLEIDLDSPEAFEEVIWKTFWPENYGAGIALWSPSNRKPKADAFLTGHMSDIVRARRMQGKDTARRYCSKNNANVARLEYLRQTYPDAQIVIPVRRPEAHAASLLRQHLNFVRQQTDDPFVRRYMRDIGHFEFGLNLKPVLFPGVDPESGDPKTPDFWLDYWIKAFRYVAQAPDACVFVLQDDLRTDPRATMTALADHLDLGSERPDFRRFFRPGADETDTGVFSSDLREQAADVYRQLESRALRP